jgi:hypothetical protein
MRFIQTRAVMNSHVASAQILAAVMNVSFRGKCAESINLDADCERVRRVFRGRMMTEWNPPVGVVGDG